MPRKPFTLIPEKMNTVVSAALAEFARYGYSHASTNRICREARISKGALFHNFHSKETLFMRLILDGVKTAEAVFREHVASQRDVASFQELFVNSFLMLLRFVQNHPEYYRIYLRLIYDPDIPETKRLKASEVVKSFTRQISETLYQQGRSGRILREDLNEEMIVFLFNVLITRFVELCFFPLRDPGLHLHNLREAELKERISSLYGLLVSGLGRS